MIYSPEEKAFRRKRFDMSLMKVAGFTEEGGCYKYKCDIMDGDFTVRLTVSGNGAVIGSLLDNMNGEEYTKIRNDSFSGGYVSSVRAAYEELLADIAVKCCKEVPFVSEQANRISAAIFDKYGVSPDFPWEKKEREHSGVFRHSDTGKWFGLIMNVKRKVLQNTTGDDTADIINLKADPEAYGRKGVYPAYHMNHKMWISVLLDDTLGDDEVMELVGVSFLLTGKKTKGDNNGKQQ